jgi:hypothetical protein
MHSNIDHQFCEKTEKILKKKDLLEPTSLKYGRVIVMFWKKGIEVEYSGLDRREDGVYIKLKIDPKAGGSITLTLTGPKGKRETKNRDSIKISDLCETPPGGPYFLNFNSRRAKKELRLTLKEGALETKGKRFGWKIYKKGDISYDVLSRVKLKVLNTGDLPVYLKDCRAKIDGKDLKHRFSPLLVMPKEEKMVEVEIEETQGRRIHLTFFDERKREKLVFTDLLPSTLP